MSKPQELPGLDSFRASMKAGNMPDDYPAESLAQLALDLRAAEAFIRTPEGAHALGVFKLDRPSNQFNANEAWAALSKTERIALAEALGRYRRAREQEATPEDASAHTNERTWRRKVEKMLRAVHELSGTTIDGVITSDESLRGAMTRVRLDPNDAEALLQALLDEGSIEERGPGEYVLTLEGAREGDHSGAAIAPLERRAPPPREPRKWLCQGRCERHS